MFCPNCKAEYKEGFTRCSDCNTDLVDQLADEEVPEALEEDRPEFLVSVADEMEADVLESKLRQFGIPIMKKFREAGAYVNIYMGRTNFGIDIYVPSKSLEYAKEIIDLKAGHEEDEAIETIAEEDLYESEVSNAEEEEEYNNAVYQRRRRLFTWIAIIFFIPGVFWFVFYYILHFFVDR